MIERRKDILLLALLLAVLLIFFGRILFTDMIIRAPDIINEFYWGVLGVKTGSLADIFNIPLSPQWNIFVNSGVTDEGGGIAGQFHLYRQLIFYLFPAPACVAWFIALQLFFGAAGVYFCCRLIGASRIAAFLGGLIFALAPENASLINAGHVIKIATITFAPWAFWSFEKAFQTRRVLWFMATSVILAFQFFGGHWQIAYYTCLCIGVYGILRSIGMLMEKKERRKPLFARLVGLNLVTMLFFLSTVAISLVPLANWSTDTNRGVQSGANQGGGGLDREEAMSWSMPPEEVATFVIPGFFGLSRQEAGENPPNINSYYWGRMVFTQTTDYMGLLPWLLLPLPLIFRRDKYTWLALIGIIGGILFSMGKYTPFYNFLFDYFPGINRFRVPKMMMFIPVLGLGLLAARGIDILLNEESRKTRAFTRYIYGVLALPVGLGILLGVELVARDYWIGRFYELLAQPTRYEQGPQLIIQRWNNLVAETGMATAVATLYAVALFAFARRWMAAGVLPLLLMALYLGDVWRINDKFMFLVKAPVHVKGVKTPVMEFLAKGGDQCRALPMDGSDPMQYASQGIPVMFTSNPVQQRRWQEFLDGFSLNSAMLDMMNVKYLIYNPAQYSQERALLGNRFAPVYQPPDGSQVVLENRTALPKAWLVPAILVSNNPVQTVGILQNPSFDPRRLALVESPPPIYMAGSESSAVASPGEVRVTRYEGEHIEIQADVTGNALLVLGEKYYNSWKVKVDGKSADIYPVNHILRGVYLIPGSHTVKFVFDPLSFKIGKYLTLTSFLFFALLLGREAWLRRRSNRGEGD
jgi:hypothetical protein